MQVGAMTTYYFIEKASSIYLLFVVFCENRSQKISLKAARYIRIKGDSREPNKREEIELLKKYADFHFSSELNENATLDNLNYEYMKEYLIATNAKADILKNFLKNLLLSLIVVKNLLMIF